MRAKYGEQRQIRLCYGTPPEGHYAMEAPADKLVHWDHCREQFAAKFTEWTKGFFFSHPQGKGESIGEFVTKFEGIVGSHFTAGIDHSTFALTSRSSILWVEPSRFWLTCPVKRSLLTILLRCGYNYRYEAPDNFDDALFGEYKESVYTKETKSAILRFLFGFTRFTGGIPYTGTFSSVIKHGWREEFHKTDDAAVRRRLVVPDGEHREMSIIGLETLWT